MKENIDNKIAVLLPYDELLKFAQEIADEADIGIIIEKISSANVTEVARSMKKKGVEIVISRGNLAKEIRNTIDVEVVSIALTGYEFLEVLYKYKDFKQPIGIVESKDFIYGCQRINKMLKLDFHYYQVNNMNEFSYQTQCAIEDGMKLLIGGSWGIEITKYLEDYNIQYEMLRSQKPSVKQAMDTALSLFYAKRREKNRHELLKTVLDFSKSGIVVVNHADEIINVNPTAEQIFRIDERSCVGQKSCKMLPQLQLNNIIKTKKAEFGSTENYFGDSVIVDRVPMVVNSEIKGAIAFIQKAAEIVTMGSNLRRDLAQRGLTAKYRFDDIIGESSAIRYAIQLAKAYSHIDSTVLITGETGTGKELFAQSIHSESRRRNNPFVAINCSALSSSLLESELFGYKEGAFTGAKKEGKVGLFELAHKGTIFLDEIGEIDINMQTKLLRVLQEHEVMRIGDNRVIPVDVRVIAATNKDLYKEMQKGNYRQDLYYRLNVLNLGLPPLRKREGDIKILMEKLRDKMNKKLNCRIEGFSPGVIELMENYNWPGNIRELENIIEKLSVLTASGIVGDEMIPFIEDCMHYDEAKEIGKAEQTLCMMEIEAIKAALQQNNGNRTHAAQQLGIDRTTLIRKIKAYDL
ncbi:sigma 54-interacting transcriptional regulator [Lutispora saccharofermentans]|uniref:Sigma 54-interacting transcriptional regulator n=1 Tax=Lutispora saccharofermentans TaxID=3024236 RepID=A0ABT1NHN4_9FIRM|nr:sigma 54-interacting transcriptional regulator [Lutispora saccharofermentans]MCQ1530772.1 sigma 54-interacting transcriptional regulator [Lutispora saccharofermentans]